LEGRDESRFRPFIQRTGRARRGRGNRPSWGKMQRVSSVAPGL